MRVLIIICFNLLLIANVAQANLLLNDNIAQVDTRHITQSNTHNIDTIYMHQGIDFMAVSVKNITRSYVKRLQSIASNDDTLYALVFNHTNLADMPINNIHNTASVDSFLPDTLAAVFSSAADFTAESTEQNSSIFTLTSADIDVSNGGKIDYVHVSPVPLPTAAWLFGSAIILFGLARRNSF